MDIGLALFLSIASVATMIFLIATVYIAHKQKTKELELEALKVRETNIQHQVEEEVSRQLKDISSRIEILEAIVTDKKYELSEKITRLK